MLEHILFLIAIWGGGTLLICTILYWIFKHFQNPFDELDDEDLKDIDEVGKTVSDLAGNIDKMLP